MHALWKGRPELRGGLWRTTVRSQDQQLSAGAHSQARDETRRPPCDDQENTRNVFFFLGWGWEGFV